LAREFASDVRREHPIFGIRNFGRRMSAAE
jgi:hypothetical protein